VLLTSGFTAQIAAFQLNKFPHVLAKPYHRSQFEHAVAAAMAPTKVEFVGSYGGAYVYVIDNDSEQRRATVRQLSAAGFTPRPYLTLDDFLADGPRHRPGVVLLETRSFEPDWRRVTAALGDRIVELPVVITSDHADIATAVGAIKAGASDVIERPLLEERLLKSLDALFLGLGRQVPARDLATRARRQLAQLTARQADVLQGLLEGLSNKELAYRLKVSARTVEMHRAKMMDRLGVKTLPEALRLAFEARDPPES
jgi:two-component system response regulator FixJ